MKFGPSGTEPKTKQGNCVPKRESSLHGTSAAAKISEVVTALKGEGEEFQWKINFQYLCPHPRGCFIPARFINATAGLGSAITL